MMKAAILLAVALVGCAAADSSAQTVVSLNGAPVTQQQSPVFGWVSPPLVSYYGLAPYQVFGHTYRRRAWVYVWRDGGGIAVNLWPENHTGYLPSTGGTVTISGVRIVVTP